MESNVRTVVAATDFSDRAERAVHRAAQLAAAHGARLHLVHAARRITPVPAWGGAGVDVWLDETKVTARLQASLDALAASMASQYGVQTSSALVDGNTRELTAQAEGADLLVIGATGEGAIARRLFGSTAQSVVRAASVPVLVVRLPAHGPYQRLIGATDLSADAERAIARGIAFAPAATLSLLTALDVPSIRIELIEGLDEAERAARVQQAREHARTELGKLAARLGHPAAGIYVRDGRPSVELLRLVEDTEAELVCIGAHGKTRLEAGLLGSTSLHAATEASCDVLVVPPAP